MNIAELHKSTKNDHYWDDLLLGVTGAYKHAQINKLLDQFFPPECESILDIGCGSCETIIKYGNKLKASTIACMDYDDQLIEKMKKLFSGYPIDWHVNDIFDLKNMDKTFNLVLLLDVLHEIYSFYGRSNRDIQKQIDHTAGQSYVENSIKNISTIVDSKGAIIITDNILCDHNNIITVQAKTDLVINAVNYFSDHYPSRKIQINFSNENIFKISAHNFCILLTQYNKIKNKNWKRWDVEKYEIHQYMTLSEYREMLTNIGFKIFYVTGIPEPALQEWEQDFQIIDGMNVFPHKRITLLAIKQ
ncbi:Methyltransferase type 11 [Candidatus Magnetomorum sp. HK-1]|nr:Methyltransferase type 11 [Candidatus Magnetomorum sp. HK-1]